MTLALPRPVLFFVALAAWALACDGEVPGADDDTSADDDGAADDDATADDDTVPDDDTTPGVPLIAREPEAGATDAWYRTDVWVRFDGPVAGVAVTLRGPGDEWVPGEVFPTDDGREAVFDPFGDGPTEHLSPATAYTATVTWDGGEETWTFSTGPLGTPLGDPSAAVGAVFGVEWLSFTITEPPGLGTFVTTYLADIQSLLVPTALDPSLGTSRVALGNAAKLEYGTIVQDRCAATIPLEGQGPLGFLDPHFETATEGFELSSDGVSLAFHDAGLGGDLSPEAASVEELTATGWTDTRGLAGIFGSEDPDTVCFILSGLQVVCEPCPTDGEPYCLTLRGEHGRADRLDGVVFAEVDEATAAANMAAGTCH